MADTQFPIHSSSQPRSRSPPVPNRSSLRSPTINSSSRRHSLPFAFTPRYPGNTSSTFLVPSTAEGRPIPLDGSTTAHRTTALRQLNRSQPSTRRRYTRASRPPSIKSTTTGTYSQPVVVRTYSGVPPTSSTRGSVSPLPQASSYSRRPDQDGAAISMKRHYGNEHTCAPKDAKLPPLESFTFRSIIANIQQDVGGDLDRIAEICAHSRYSLSNQYEVHIAPQGSGGIFSAPQPTPSLTHDVPAGPTLQAISSDDEHMDTIQRNRRNTMRRTSVAYGTLETIMSSSRSSDEDKAKKKSAAEIVKEVGRSAAGGSKDESPAVTSTAEAYASSGPWGDEPRSPQSRSTAFAAAVINSSNNLIQSETESYSAPGTTLPTSLTKSQASQNHLQVEATTRWLKVRPSLSEHPPQQPMMVQWEAVATAAISAPKEPKATFGWFFKINDWSPWEKFTVSNAGSLNIERFKFSLSYAENTLRRLLNITK
ncbi:hypothetical protein GGR54DRAFT_51926 [Hypoxylon sp. NC1633]|nr:hypothetical protein GGR54DRAFT_51926 [Hypoxylon sp. NC1633]